MIGGGSLCPSFTWSWHFHPIWLKCQLWMRGQLFPMDSVWPPVRTSPGSTLLWVMPRPHPCSTENYWDWWARPAPSWQRGAGSQVTCNHMESQRVEYDLTTTRVETNSLRVLTGMRWQGAVFQQGITSTFFWMRTGSILWANTSNPAFFSIPLFLSLCEIKYQFGKAQQQVGGSRLS